MGKVPLLTREQEVEICKKIEDAEVEMKRIVYGLGFTAKEHIAIAEKLLSEPPKERFDRVIVDKKIANREGHLQGFAQAHQEGARDGRRMWTQNISPGRRRSKKAARKNWRSELKKLSAKLQETFAKFYYKQKVVEEMIVVAGNIHEKFQASFRHLAGTGNPPQHARKSARPSRPSSRKSRRSNSSCGCRARNFSRRSRR